VRAAFLAAGLRAAAPRFRAVLRAWRASDECEAADRPSRFSAALTARDRVAETLRLGFRPFAESRAACAFIFFEDPGLGGGSFTPARRAFDSPIATACLELRAPCLPSRM